MSGSGATPVSQKKVQSYSGQHEPGLKDQLEAVLARCDGYQIQTSNKGQNRQVPLGTMSRNFDLYQPSNDYDKSVLSKAGFVWVSGPDALGNKQEGYIKRSDAKAFQEWFQLPKASASTTFLAQAASLKSAAGETQSAKAPTGIAGRRLEDFKSKFRSVGSPAPVTGPQAKASGSAEGKANGDLKSQLDDYTNSLGLETDKKAANKQNSATRLPPSPSIPVAEEDLDSVSKPLATIIDVEFPLRGEKVTLHLGGSTADTGNLRSLFGIDLKARYWRPSSYKEVPPRGWLLVNESVLNGSDPKKSSGPSYLIPREDVKKDLLPALEGCDRKMREEIESR